MQRPDRTRRRRLASGRAGAVALRLAAAVAAGLLVAACNSEPIVSGYIADEKTLSELKPGTSAEAVLAHVAAGSDLAARLLGALRPTAPRPMAVAGVPYGYIHRGDGPYRAGDQAAVVHAARMFYRLYAGVFESLRGPAALAEAA